MDDNNDNSSKHYHFINRHYSKDTILDIFGVNDELINSII
jgi:hypothetical protein